MKNEQIASLFTTFAESECQGSSPLYEYLSLGVANSPDLLDIAARGRIPIPNLFFAAVHDLLLQNPGVPLAKYYPSMRGSQLPDSELMAIFRDFCAHQRVAIEQIITTRHVQTNEVRRCGYLVPAFALVARLGGDQPLSLIELGCSAGFNLLWDHYGYDFGEGRRWGESASQVQIRSQCRNPLPLLPQEPPHIHTRIGLDLNPIHAKDMNAVRWLEALIWPEHTDRRALLRAALELASLAKIQFVAGDASVTLTDVLPGLPDATTLCIFQTHSLNQFPTDALERLLTTLKAAGRDRPVYFLSRHDQLTLDIWEPTGHSQRVLTTCDAHGRWFAWEANCPI
jgi:hypothetical protein